MRFLICAIFLLILQSANSQALSKKYIDDWVIKCNPKIEQRDLKVYVLDGKSIESSKVDSLLKTWHYSKLLSIVFGKIDTLSYENPRANYVIIESKGHQSKKQKRNLLKEAITKYDPSQLYTNHIRSDSKEPVLLINDKEIFHSDCYKELSKLKERDIYGISVYNYSVPWEIYGQNAKNGLIQIWTHP